jgi:hypothetical protein
VRTAVWVVLGALLVVLGVACAGSGSPECVPGRSFKSAPDGNYHCEDNGTGAHWVKD